MFCGPVELTRPVGWIVPCVGAVLAKRRARLAASSQKSVLEMLLAKGAY